MSNWILPQHFLSNIFGSTNCLSMCVSERTHYMKHNWNPDKQVHNIIEPQHDKTNKMTYMCAQQRLRSAWASAQSLPCPHEETYGPQLPIECTVKTLISVFTGCTGHFVSSPDPKDHWWAYRIGRPLSSVCVYVNIFKHLLFRDHWADWSQIPP